MLILNGVTVLTEVYCIKDLAMFVAVKDLAMFVAGGVVAILGGKFNGDDGRTGECGDLGDWLPLLHPA